MLASLLMRFGVLILVVGLCLGIAMGITQNFTLAPAHAHLNLVGAILPFLAGLYYRAVPEAARGPLATLQAWLAIVGAVLFPTGIAAMIGIGHGYEPLAIVGSLIVLAAWLLFAVIVFRTRVARLA
jgi:hypothetical protein